jgi:hypothetical protein
MNKLINFIEDELWALFTPVAALAAIVWFFFAA